ncbi:MAG: mechanosensitive ion channel [Pirellulaceae bacterium]|nr:mechanosensitive ion channel [Pirellulaceae bacterium]
MPSCPVARAAIVSCLVLLSVIPLAPAQDTVSELPAAEISREQIRTKLAAIELATEFDDTQRGRIVESYRRTLNEPATQAKLNSEPTIVEHGTMDVQSRLDETRLIVVCGLDRKQSREVVPGIAKAHPTVLDDPQPSVVMDAVGDSTLSLTLRCFLPDLDQLLPAKHAIDETLHCELRIAGIEIAFPQRDLHVRSIAVPFRLDRDETNDTPSATEQ